MTKEDKPDAWMPLYIGDWEGDTRHLDCEQDGAYGRLVRHYWRNGPLPDEDAQLARIVGMALGRWRKVRPVLVAFFTVKAGRWNHKRVDAEIVRWSGKKAAAVEKARQAAEKRWKKDAPSTATGMPQAMLEQCPSASSGKEDDLTGQSSLSGRERSEARHEGASDARSSVEGLSAEELMARIREEQAAMEGAQIIPIADRRQA